MHADVAIVTPDTLSYSIDARRLTIVATDKFGERFDLNATGTPCETLDELRAYVHELFAQGAFDAAERDRLLASVC